MARLLPVFYARPPLFCDHDPSYRNRNKIQPIDKIYYTSLLPKVNHLTSPAVAIWVVSRKELTVAQVRSSLCMPRATPCTEPMDRCIADIPFVNNTI